MQLSSTHRCQPRVTLQGTKRVLLDQRGWTQPPHKICTEVMSPRQMLLNQPWPLQVEWMTELKEKLSSRSLLAEWDHQKLLWIELVTLKWGLLTKLSTCNLKKQQVFRMVNEVGHSDCQMHFLELRTKTFQAQSCDKFHQNQALAKALTQELSWVKSSKISSSTNKILKMNSNAKLKSKGQGESKRTISNLLFSFPQMLMQFKMFNNSSNEACSMSEENEL